MKNLIMLNVLEKKGPFWNRKRVVVQELINPNKIVNVEPKGTGSRIHLLTYYIDVQETVGEIHSITSDHLEIFE